jgi:hypothetical protein
VHTIENIFPAALLDGLYIIMSCSEATAQNYKYDKWEEKKNHLRLGYNHHNHSQPAAPGPTARGT